MYLLWNSSNEEPAVIHAHADAEGTPLSYLIIIELLHALLGLSGGGENDESITSVQFAEMVHHQTDFVYRSNLLKYRHQFVLKTVARDLADKYLRASWRWGTVPIGRRAIPTLAVLLHERVAGSFEQVGNWCGGLQLI